MVSDRQKRNWGKKVFQRLDENGNVLEAQEEFSDIEMQKPPEVKYSQEIDPEDEPDGFELDVAKLRREAVLAKLRAKESQNDDFKPTKRQLQAKLRFHKYAPRRLVMGMFDDEPGITVFIGGNSYYLPEYIGQIKEDELERWLDIPKFWEWFITDDATDADLYSAQKAASNYLLQIMEMDEHDEEGNLDLKRVSLKVRIAESIMKQNKQTKIENKTVNVFGGGGNSKMVLPKSVAKMDTVEMENKIKLLKEHSNG